ncbi:hypothetical protein GQ457_08G009200 [Hibiscus cannabinus]
MSSENLADANLNGVPFGLHGGQPPGGLVSIGQVSVLERPVSPSALVNQPAAKKGMSDFDCVEGMECESDVVEVSTGVTGRDAEPIIMEGTGDAVANGSDKVSYATIAAKSAKSGKNFNFSEVDVVVRDEDCLVDVSGAFPKIQFSEKVHDQIDLSMRNVIIVRLLGKVIGYGALLNRLHVLWRPTGEIQLIDLDNEYYLVRFVDTSDYSRALTDGPWTIYGSYLIVQPWSRSFSTSEKHPSHVVVWIRLPGLPYRYYCKALFRRIAAVIGRVIKVDYNTKEVGRGKFARLVVLVDLNKPLKACIGIDNFVQRLEYEGLQHICFGYGVYGHSKEECRADKESKTEMREDVGNRGPRVGSDGSPQELYGPWMMVVNRRRRFSRGEASNISTRRSEGIATASRFSVLNENVAEGELPSEDALARDVPSGFDQAVGRPTSRRQASADNGLLQDRGVRFNKSYIESNPSRKSKGTDTIASGSKRVEVVSLLEEHPAEASIREVSMASGSHVAISVSDKGDAARSLHKRWEGLSVAKGRGKENRALRHGLGNDFEVMDDDDPDDSQGDGDAAILPLVRRDRVSADNMDVGPLQNFVRANQPNVVFLLETRISGSMADRVIGRLEFPNSFQIEASGFSGGIWMLWRSDVVVDITHISTQFLNCRCQFQDSLDWVQIMAVYASPMARVRKLLWNPLAGLDPGDFVPCRKFSGPRVYHLDRVGSDRGIDRALQRGHSDFLRDLVIRLKDELEMVLEQEESLWFQKARTQWISQGDRNTRFFHASTMARRRRNFIVGLQLEDGQWCTDQDTLKLRAIDYFTKLFTSSGVVGASFYGLLAAWSLGLLHLIVEVDSSDAINLIRQYKVGEATLALVPHIVSLINRNWSIQLSHVLREGNVLADCMAKFSHWNDLICHRFLLPPESLVSMVEQDYHDSSFEGG